MKDSLLTLSPEIISKLIKISRRAGESIMEIYESNFDIDLKDDKSPLTEADISSNRIICQSLTEMAPDIPILSEESSIIPYAERSKWKQYWLVDPLDGTKEFIKRNGEFTTNIAYVYNNKPIFGMIHVPVTKEIYWGAEDKGSFYISGDNGTKSEKISVSNDSHKNLKIVSSRSHPSGSLKLLLDNLDDVEVVGIGSSLKFCLIAKGEADCYPRFGPTSEWDTAAGEVIAKAAGATVVNLNNQELLYNSQNEGYLNPYFLVSNSIKNREKILSIYNQFVR